MYSAQNISAGINLTFDMINSSVNSPRVYDISDITYIFPNSTNLNLDQTTYGITTTANLYQKKVLIYSSNGEPSTYLCSSSLSNLNYDTCQINYTNSMISSIQTYYAYVCNEYNECSLGYPFTFRHFDQAEEIRGGIKLTFGSYIDLISNLIPHYTSSTPFDNYRKVGLSNFTIEVDLEDKTVSNCIIQINSTNYSMTLNNNLCAYNYTFPQGQSFVQFKAYYNESGTIKSLEERNVYSYADRNFAKYNSSSFFNSLILLLGGFFYFLFKNHSFKLNKKGISPVITITLLLLVLTVSFTSLSSWFLHFQSDFENKFVDNIENTQIILEEFKYTSLNTANLYIRNTNNKYYGIVKEIKINSEICTLDGADVIGENMISLIKITCSQSLIGVGNVAIITDIGIEEKSVLLGN